jgi:hypothetical protein
VYQVFFQGAGCTILAGMLYPAGGITDFEGGIFYFDGHPGFDYCVDRLSGDGFAESGTEAG